MRSYYVCSSVLLVSLVFLLCSKETNARWRRYYGKFEPVKLEQCTYKGYTPGGGIPNIKPIPTPVAKGLKTSLAFITGLIGHGAEIGSATANGLAEAAAAIKKVAKVASKLSAGLGVFAAAFGVVSSFASPTPEDILNKVNKAFAEMSKDVNNRLKTMEGYVDGRVIKLEQNLMKNEFAALQRYFTSCIRGIHEQEVRTCQRFANKKIYGELPNFQKLSVQFKGRAKTLKMYDIKRLEASLPSFRDYASLHLTSLQLLVNSYREDPYSKEKKSRLKLYLQDLQTFGISYNHYVHWAYGLIHKRQIDENYGRNGALNKPTFDKVNALREGFWNGVHTYDWQIVHPVCVPSDDKNQVNKCEIKAMIRVDGKRPGSPYRQYWASRGSYREVMKRLAEKKAKTLCGRFMSAFKRDLETYWKKELLDVASVWKQVSDKASKDLQNLDKILKEKPAPPVVDKSLQEIGNGGGNCTCKKMYKIPGFNLALCSL